MTLWALVGPGALRAQQDCNTAFPVCANVYNQPQSFVGTGTVAEAGGTCLNGESASAWYVFTAQTAGSLTFLLNTPLDYDFALYNITNSGCASLPPPIRCNYSGANGNTGLTLPAQAELPALGVAAPGPPLMPGVNVAAGQTYALLINNWNRNTNGYTLTFGGTATIADRTPPTLAAVGLAPRIAGPGPCDLIVTTSEPVQCSSVAADGSDFRIVSTQGSVAVVSAGGIGCGNFTNQIRAGISLQQPDTCGSWAVRLRQGTDGTTLTDVCGNQAAPGGGAVLVASPAVPSLALPGEVFCGGSQVLADGSASTGEINHFWSVVESDANWNVIGRECSDWFSGTAGTMDITQFGAQRGCPLQCGRWYRVKLAVQNCCTGWSETVKLIRIQCPRADAGPDRTFCCGGAPVQIGTPGLPGPHSYGWTGPGGEVISSRPTAAVSPAQPSTYTVRVTDGLGCSATDTVTVNVLCRPQVSLSVTPPASCCESTQMITATVTGGGTVKWQPGGATGPQISVAPSKETTYTATATNACFSSSASVTVKPAKLSGAVPSGNIIFPNAFTPNGDGRNDIYTIYHLGLGAGEVPAYNALGWRLTVFSRGCALATLENSPTCPPGIPNGQIQWDGKAYRNCGRKIKPGKIVPQGVYPWVLELRICSKGWVRAKTGSVTVLR